MSCMDFRCREALRNSRPFLKKKINFDELLDHMIHQDIFSEEMLDHIKSGASNVDRISRLLDHLYTRPNDCFGKFLHALTISGHIHCRKEVERQYTLSGPTQDSTEVSHPSPENEFHFSNPVQQEQDPSFQRQTPLPHARNPVPMDEGEGFGNTGNEYTSLSVQHPSGDSRYAFSQTEAPSMNTYSTVESCPVQAYKMNSAPRGLVLLINNEQFKTMSARQGSQCDQENFHDMFHLLGFTVNQEQDQTADEMLALLKSFAIDNALRDVDALAVVILSHGGPGGKIFGKDGSHQNSSQHGPVSYITADDITKVFSARSCPLMANKPKLIIVQACRGHDEDGPDGSGPRHRPAVVSGASSGLDKDDGPSSASSSDSRTSITRNAEMADICLIQSTVEGFVSYRHPQDGSPFVEELTSVFKEKAHQESLMDMMTEVNDRLAKRVLQDDLRTVSSTTHTLTRKWFFNPPIAARAQQ